MRNLEDWNACRVRFDGFISYDGGRKPGRLLLNHVRVCLYWDNKGSKRRIFDHLWLFDDNVEAIVKESRFRQHDRVIGVGKVHQYSRANGSMDFGIRQTQVLGVAQFEKVASLSIPEQYDAAALIVRALKEEFFGLSIDDDIEEFQRCIQLKYAELHKQMQRRKRGKTGFKELLRKTR